MWRKTTRIRIRKKLSTFYPQPSALSTHHPHPLEIESTTDENRKIFEVIRTVDQNESFLRECLNA
jgi:hypothetical protein